MKGFEPATFQPALVAWDEKDIRLTLDYTLYILTYRLKVHIKK